MRGLVIGVLRLEHIQFVWNFLTSVNPTGIRSIAQYAVIGVFLIPRILHFSRL